MNITFSPQSPKAGEMLRLTCTSGPSNPPASISWLKKNNNDTVMKGSNLGNSPGINGGYTSTNVLEIPNPSATDDGALYFCIAKNLHLSKEFSDAITLSVKCKFIRILTRPFFLKEYFVYKHEDKLGRGNQKWAI